MGIALAGVTLLHERMSGAQRAAAGLALTGVVYVIAKGDLGNLRALRLTPGDGWIVVAAAGWIAYSGAAVALEVGVAQGRGWPRSSPAGWS